MFNLLIISIFRNSYACFQSILRMPQHTGCRIGFDRRVGYRRGNIDGRGTYEYTDSSSTYICCFTCICTISKVVYWMKLCKQDVRYIHNSFTRGMSIYYDLLNQPLNVISAEKLLFHVVNQISAHHIRYVHIHPKDFVSNTAMHTIPCVLCLTIFGLKMKLRALNAA